jgi:alcohol dehydrogenase
MDSHDVPINQSLAPFDHQSRTRMVFGVNAVDRVGRLATELGGKFALLVTDRGIVAAGHAARVAKLLEAEGIKVACFDQVEENPGTRCVDKCVELAGNSGANLIVGLGGGSSMDTAKGCNFLLTNGGRMKDYWGVGKAKHPMLPLIAIPTTGGTGSECQSFALITDEHTHQKMACGDPKAAARVALLDPALTVSQPRRVTACSGIDAVAHALETAVTNARTSLSLMYSREALRLTLAGLPRVLASPHDLEARGWMLLGAALGGTAIENSMLGAAHAAANPLTAHFGIVHGHAVGLMLPHVIRFNAGDPAAASAYEEALLVTGIVVEAKTALPAAEVLARSVEQLLRQAGLASSLRELGVPAGAPTKLAAEAASQWTARFNPRPVAAPDFEQIYLAAMEP